jgi:ankyrin repeat protein
MLLEDFRANCAVQDEELCTPLHLAVRANKVDVVVEMLRHIDRLKHAESGELALNMRDKRHKGQDIHKTPLDYALGVLASAPTGGDKEHKDQRDRNAAKLAEMLLGTEGQQYDAGRNSNFTQDPAARVPHRLRELLIKKREEHIALHADSWKDSTSQEMPLLQYIVRSQNREALVSELRALKHSGSEKNDNDMRLSEALCLAIVLHDQTTDQRNRAIILELVECFVLHGSVDACGNKLEVEVSDGIGAAKELCGHAGRTPLALAMVTDTPEPRIILALLEKLMPEKGEHGTGGDKALVAGNKSEHTLVQDDELLCWAVSSGATDVVRFLLSPVRDRRPFPSLPQPTVMRRNLYHFAAEARTGADQMISLLSSLHSGNNLELLVARDEQGRSPLHIAAEKHNVSAVGELCKRIREKSGLAGSERAHEHIVQKDTVNGFTPLHAVIEALRTASDQLELAKECTTLLLQAGADVATVRDKSDRTALMLATEDAELQPLTFLMLQERQDTSKASSEKNHAIGRGLLVMANFLDFQKRQYTESKELRERTLNRLILPAIFFASLATVLSLALDGYEHGPVIVAVIAGANGFLLTVVQHLKLDAQAEAHRMTAHHFDRLTTMSEFYSQQLNLFPSDKTAAEAERFLSDLERDVKDIKQANQFVLPREIRRKNRGNVNAFKREMAKMVSVLQVNLVRTITWCSHGCNPPPPTVRQRADAAGGRRHRGNQGNAGAVGCDHHKEPQCCGHHR